MANVTHQLAAANAFGDSPTPRGPRQSQLDTQQIELAIGTDNLGAGDLWKFIHLKSGTAIYDIRLEVTDLDSDGAPTLTIDLGHDGNDDEFLANSTIGQAGGAAFGTGTPFVLDQDRTIQAKVEAAAATAAAGTATCTIVFGPAT